MAGVQWRITRAVTLPPAPHAAAGDRGRAPVERHDLPNRIDGEMTQQVVHAADCLVERDDEIVRHHTCLGCRLPAATSATATARGFSSR